MMIEKMIDKFVGQMTIEQSLDPDKFTLTTCTRWGDRVLHEHAFDLEPMFQIFRARMEGKKGVR